MSLPEVLLWIDLRKRPGGHKFRKQVPQHPYALDFACLRARVAIEVLNNMEGCIAGIVALCDERGTPPPPLRGGPPPRSGEDL